MATCKKHSECATGYCDKAVCTKPQEHNPCKAGQCPSNLTCYAPLNRCKRPGATWNNQTCKATIHCSPEKYCLNSQCVGRPGGGESCNSTKLCYAGHSCLQGICVKRCSGNSDCSSSEECKAVSANSPYKTCVAKPKPVKKPAAKPPTKPTAVPVSTQPPVAKPPVTPAKPDSNKPSSQSWKSFFTWDNLTEKKVLIPFGSILGVGILLIILVVILYRRKKRRQVLEMPSAPSMPPMEGSNYMAAPPSYHDVANEPTYTEKA